LETFKVPVHRDGQVVAFAEVDGESVAELSRHVWHLNSHGYACRYERRDDGTQRIVLMHRQVLGLVEGDGILTDHINRDRLVNTKQNLRKVTCAQNAQNKAPYKNSQSGVRGVWFEPRRGKWQAKVILDKRGHHVGYFSTLEQAAAEAATFRARHMPFSADAGRNGAVECP